MATSLAKQYHNGHDELLHFTTPTAVRFQTQVALNVQASNNEGSKQNLILFLTLRLVTQTWNETGAELCKAHVTTIQSSAVSPVGSKYQQCFHVQSGLAVDCHDS